MSLAPGTHLGGYRIVGLLGEGGMGQVYRAHDSKLGREVALKILPDAFTHDSDRLARFRREAQLLASLNHPNIAAIYGVEDAGDTRALVLELVEGPTLQERLKAHGSGPGRLPLNEALDIARQIADALQAAHERGIIHRDLKPANVKVREDGTVKVLDFGLAKAAQNQASDSGLQAPGDLSQSPTITSPAMMTGVGMILGTAAYMAPEQAKGRPADKRSDVWAFGCVLYEMLTGKRPFGGDEVSDTLASVLKEEPDWTALPSTVPPAIRTLVQRCLVKDRHRRVADIAAAQFVLAEHAGLTTASGSAADGNRSGRSGLAWMAAAVLLTAALFGSGLWRFWPADPPAPGMVRFTFRAPEGAPFSSLVRQGVAISPNGTQIVYAAGGRLYRRAVDELESHAITGMDLPVTPTFAPDGQSVAFYSSSERTLKRVLTIGGTPTSIGRSSSEVPWGINWGETGIVFAFSRRGIFRVSPNGGEPEQIVRVEAGEIVWGPQLLPGGGSVLFTLSDAAVVNWDAAKVVVQSLTSGERTVVVNGGSDARYLSSGHLIYSVSGTVFAVRFDPASQATIGDAVPVLAGVRRSSGASGATQYSVSDTGALVYVPSSRTLMFAGFRSRWMMPRSCAA